MTWATDRLDAIKAGVSVPPVVATLQLGGLDEWGAKWVRKTWIPKPDLLNSDGSLFGGYVAALADQMLAFAAMTVVPGDSLFRTINLSVNFVRIGRAAPLMIEARVVAVTKRLITVRVEFRRDDGDLIAEATAQQIVEPFGRG
ncbi:PaaI family thioesterase [Polymorphobacter sp. PAMC 29334]|uniref:PaaI family thioesterase n=1 Tax=Polymorphobacter sp. PAMC 29334 TaxID=2862331 RepID=UPI001C663F6F|nr:PaaI family thioesterase [Polymorphobacter sp. PAMC 29334]QYE33663.1 PaaI family thioesterase [Polymorphobacter sp. PAMC 29334]